VDGTAFIVNRTSDDYCALLTVYRSVVYRKAISYGPRPPKGAMVRLQIHELMTARGITAYALSKGGRLLALARGP
jgi:hypothetical protein